MSIKEIYHFSPEIGYNTPLLLEEISVLENIPTDRIRLLKRSLDARWKSIKIRMEVELLTEPITSPLTLDISYQDVSHKKRVIIVGAGPAGMFAALRLIELGLKPVLIERGKDVRARRRDLAAINKDNIVNEDSNYCFGEGGAGTYSDGKLYTRSSKRGDIKRILEILVQHGANEEILYEAHPHIGTNKLPKLVEQLRETILKYGGEVHFNQRVTDFLIENNTIKGCITNRNQSFEGEAVILATGHSARDIYHLLHQRNILIEAKPFAMGVRIEHPQHLIDKVQYHGHERGLLLPAASYSLVHQVKYKGVERGVFSFCMCPGGFIVPAATAQNELVVNGMSPSKRDSKFANSGLVVAINLEDMLPYQAHNQLAGLEMQKSFEHLIWEAGGKTQSAPAQRVSDFINGKLSPSLNDTSYIPGLVSSPLHDVIPPYFRYRLQEALKTFGKKIKGYDSNEGQIIGAESRTSSPVRIPRHKITLEHPQIKGLYPCGEGAGYAGGIVSAAMDGEQVAEQIVKSLG